MPSTHNPTLDLVLYILAGVAVLFLGYRIGRWIEAIVKAKHIAGKEQELFTTQRGFKQLYEQELAKLKEDNAGLLEKVKTLEARVEEYRKKAAGFGGLFGGGKKADAMYALLLENESLEEALFTQNEKLKQERTDALKESIRSVGYRRVLMSQLLNDDRIKNVVAEMIGDDRRLPSPQTASGESTHLQTPTVTNPAE
jgi:DNA repair exonuclease SbcCD ATPase subunit